MNAIFDIAAPAKLNLFLHVLGKRPDGYHLLQSVFMLIDWYDTLHFERRSTNSISREDIDIKLPTEDLCTRAAKALQSATGCTNGVHITLEKRIPHQAGLGGGSSDAASTLMALNKLWSLNLDKSELKAIGLTIGADVPFFIEGHHCWVEGIGDQITPLPESLWPIEGSQFIVVKPRGGIATSSIFSALSLKPEKKNCYNPRLR
jgi:4-diphosphocytidyl-2-C-methyl-D-erythritol kinase